MFDNMTTPMYIVLQKCKAIKMKTVRFDLKIEHQLSLIAKKEKESLSNVLRKAAEAYIRQYFNRKTPYELGKHLFGVHCSETNRNLSKDRKKLFREKVNAKSNYRRRTSRVAI